MDFLGGDRRGVAELIKKNSNGPDKPQEDFLTLLWRKMLLDKGAWEGSCGTLIGGILWRKLRVLRLTI